MARRQGTEILELLMPMFSGHKDDYGKDVVPPLPLSFDRVNQGQPPISTAPLFQLPAEILGEVLQYIPWSSLALVALVNRDFRQLARSRQFASVQLDYSDFSLDLVETLMAEERERAADSGTRQSRSIGPCIRRITVATNPSWISHRHGVELRTLKDLEKAEREKRMSDASSAFFDGYLFKLRSLLPILPHLELLDWEDQIALPRSFFDSLACSHIQHLKLFRVSVDDEFQLRLPNMRGSGVWPLRTLHLELLRNPAVSEDISTLPLCASILRSCAPTLEALKWITMSDIEEEPSPTAVEAMETLPRFTALRSLTMNHVRHMRPSFLSSLVQDGLYTLDVKTEASPVYSDFFRQRGCIRSLTTFVWRDSRLPIDHRLEFLRANPHLCKLAVPRAAPEDLLETTLLPLLVSSFYALKSLTLTWDGLFISESALETIGYLTSLEQIHLSAGNQFGWRHDWLIDHGSMRKYLSRLPNLRKIAFSRDSYKSHDGSNLSEVESYYGHQALFGEPLRLYVEQLLATRQPTRTIQDLENVRMSLWERIHREKMSSEALLYMDAVKKLEWICIGQLPIQCFRGPKDSVHPAAERDSCWTLLGMMFGGRTGF